MIGDEINFSGNISGKDNLTIQPLSENQNIKIGGYDSGNSTIMDLNSAELNLLQNGFTLITIGSDNSNGTITVDSNGVIFKDPTILQSPQGSLTIDGTITGIDDASITLISSGSKTTLNADIITAGNPITIQDNIVLGTNINLNTTDQNQSGANITIDGTINGTTSNSQNLTLTAGIGDINITGAVGNSQTLGDLIANSNSTTIFNNTVNATSLTTDSGGTTQLNGNVTTTGKQTYNDSVILGNNLNLQSNGSDIIFANTINGNGNYDLSLSVGNADITFKNAIGNLTRLGNLIIENANNINAEAITATSITATADNNITMGDLDSSSNNSNGGNLSLISKNGIITTGNLNSSGNSGGDIFINAEIAIATGAINSSGSDGDGGNVTLDPEDDIQVTSINAQGGSNGVGGTIDLTTESFFQATGTFIDQNGIEASISTAGGAGR
ncbi:MAG: hypothetical protein F6K10_02850 [Moorea sp. SIO2B7]|nr:hypothetical protein [Moorena sp. SIO2B7]